MPPHADDDQNVPSARIPPIAGEPTHDATTKNSKTPITTDSAVLYAKMNSKPAAAESGMGCYIQTADGKRILDASGGAAVAVIGHNNVRVKNAIIAQLDKIAYCYAPFFTTEAAEKLARELSASTHGRLPKSFIVSSGTEAIEAALKLARQYFLELPDKQPQRTHFIARLQSYHGNTLGSLSLGGHMARRAPYQPILSTNVSHVSPCYPYRNKADGESDSEYVARLAQELEDEFQRVGPRNVCAFVAETVSGTTLGTVPSTPGYLRAMRQVCNRHGALFILDEVMSGMGRTGTTHAWEQEDVVPDLQTVAKGLGAGYAPIGALMIGEKIVAALSDGSGAFVHSQTYQGHPVACAAAHEVQQIVKEDKLLDNVRSMGTYLGGLLEERLGSHPHVGEIRGRGLFWGVEFVMDKATKEPFPAERKIAPMIQQAGMMDHGVSVIPCIGIADGRVGDAIQIAPPYNVKKEEIEEIVAKVSASVKQVIG